VATRNIGSARRRCVQSSCKYATLTGDRCPRCGGKAYRWEVRLTVPDPTNAKPNNKVQVSGWGATRTEAQQAANENIKRRALTETKRGFRVVTVGEGLDEYLAHRLAARDLEPQSYANYGHQAAWIKRHIGNVPMPNLKRDHVIATWGAEKAAGRAEATIHSGASLLRMMLAWAGEEKGYHEHDALKLVPRVPVGNRRRDVLTVDQVRSYLAALVGHPWEALFVLPMLGMFRTGELGALRWSAVDLEARTVTVRLSLCRVSPATAELFGVDSVRAKDPKTEAAFRTVLLPSQAIDALRRHLEAQQAHYAATGRTWTPDLYVFQEANGRPVHASTTRERWYRFQRERGVLPDNLVTVHGLRRTAASLEMGAGQPEVTRKRIGHTDLDMLVTYQQTGGGINHQQPAVAYVEGLINPEGELSELDRLREENARLREENARLRGVAA
jgi:integrase